MRVSESLFVCSLGCKLRGAHLGRQQQRVFGKDCLDLLLLDLITAVFGPVEGSFAVLKRAGVSAGAWRARACMCGTATQTRTIACTLQTHVVFFIHVSALLDQVRHQLDHALVSRIKERMLGSVLAQGCLDLVVLGQVESGFAPLSGQGCQRMRGEGVHACAAHLHPSLYLAAR